MSEYPQKEFYRLNEVCRYTDTQPYVLRFWESEFPQLSPERSGNGQPIYRKEDIDLVRRIKQLLHEEECSLELARQALDRDKGDAARRPAAAKAQAAEMPSAAVMPMREIADAPPSQREPDTDLVPRQRYEDAVEEVHHLRRQLKEAETARRKAETSLQEAGDEGERYRGKAVRASRRIEELLESLS